MQDPVARTVSSHNMLQSVLQQDDYCVKGPDGEKLCRPVQSLLDLTRSSAALNIDWPEHLSGCNFNSTVRRPKPHYSRLLHSCGELCSATNWMFHIHNLIVSAMQS